MDIKPSIYAPFKPPYLKPKNQQMNRQTNIPSSTQQVHPNHTSFVQQQDYPNYDYSAQQQVYPNYISSAQQQVYPNQTTKQFLNPITQNIIFQIPPTEKPLMLTLNLKFEN
ncbi:18577_t:CDS:2 [Racocetra fulgida]|uniref:18577_t:CDS:1 n=1 Tax=Racocetra fulgida TaxID=60492 RepID=A0A9N8VE36_9GLOM|nr:18577_t:CDS:2 [Racocetra fulgida]